MRINLKFSLYFFIMAMMLVLPFFISIPVSRADITSDQNPNILGASSFLVIDPSSYKLNGVGKGTDGFIHLTTSFYDLPLEVTGGIPYKIDIINKGNIRQNVNGTIKTIFAYEMYYYYTISLVTLGDQNVINVPSYTINEVLYHYGWGADPWGLGQIGRADMQFSTYNTSAFSTNPVNKLTSWRWLGKLTYDVSINPQFQFPQNITIIDGDWMYSGIEFGIIGTTIVKAEKGFAQDQTVYVDGISISPANKQNKSVSPTTTGQNLVDGKYSPDDIRAVYKGYIDQSYNSPRQNKAPSTGTNLMMTTKSNNRPFNQTITPIFDISFNSLQSLTQQQAVTTSVEGIWLQPEVWIFEGLHSWHYVDKFYALFGDIVNQQDKTARVVRGWEVWNVYQIIHFKTGVRVLSLYDWSPYQETKGEPQGNPDWETGDRIINTGFDGATSAETTFEWFLGNWIWIVIIIIVAIVGIWLVTKFMGGRGGGSKTTIYTAPRGESSPQPQPQLVKMDSRKRKKRSFGFW